MSNVRLTDSKQLGSTGKEASRLISTQLHKNDLKGYGPSYNVARENNGDILRWTYVGGAMGKDGERYAAPMQKKDRVHDMLATSAWSSDLKRSSSVNRKDFSGQGNIISWM